MAMAPTYGVQSEKYLDHNIEKELHSLQIIHTSFSLSPSTAFSRFGVDSTVVMAAGGIRFLK